MPPKVDNLERRVTDLETLPDRITAVESQIVQLRTEMRGEFSAVREEIRSGDEKPAACSACGSMRPPVCSANGSTRTAVTCACCTKRSSAASRLFRKGSRRRGAGAGKIRLKSPGWCVAEPALIASPIAALALQRPLSPCHTAIRPGAPQWHSARRPAAIGGADMGRADRAGP